jgi:hypothetical protein
LFPNWRRTAKGSNNGCDDFHLLLYVEWDFLLLGSYYGHRLEVGTFKDSGIFFEWRNGGNNWLALC